MSHAPGRRSDYVQSPPQVMSSSSSSWFSPITSHPFGPSLSLKLTQIHALRGSVIISLPGFLVYARLSFEQRMVLPLPFLLLLSAPSGCNELGSILSPESVYFPQLLGSA